MMSDRSIEDHGYREKRMTSMYLSTNLPGTKYVLVQIIVPVDTRVRLKVTMGVLSQCSNLNVANQQLA